MIKRQFYKQEHAEKNVASDSFSSSSDSELEVGTEEVNFEDYSSIDFNAYRRGSPITSDDDGETKNTQISASRKSETLDKWSMARDGQFSLPFDVPSCVLKRKSVFKCRLCPKIICLNEETLKDHLKSKKHGRSEKLFKEGKMKFMLNSDGELDEEAETHAERHTRIMVLAEEKLTEEPKKKRFGRQRQRQRIKRKRNSEKLSMEKAVLLEKNLASKKSKTKD